MKVNLKERELGALRECHMAQGANECVLIFQDNPENWSVRWSIAQALEFLRNVRVVCQVGAFTKLDEQMDFMRALPDEAIRDSTALYFLRKLMIHPAEYANLRRGEKPIQLYGVENEELYKEAVELFKTQSRFLPHQIKRAQAITKNVLELMTTLRESLCVLLCDGDLPDLISEELEKTGRSFAVIRPKMTYPSDVEYYHKILHGGKEAYPSYEEIINEAADLPPLPPDDDFPDKRNDDKKEKFRARLVRLIESETFLSEYGDLLPLTSRIRVRKILDSKKEGPKAKAVRVKAVLLHLIQLSTAKKNVKPIDAVFTWMGIIGFVATLVFAFFGGGVESWYLKSIVFIFGVTCFGKTAVKRFGSALGWLLYSFGFVSGYYLFGGLGILLGILLAALFWLTFLFFHEAPLLRLRHGLGQLIES